MRRILSLLAISGMFVIPVLAQFEGEIDMKMSAFTGDKPKEHTIFMLIKKDMIAISSAGESGMDKNSRVIFREDKKMMWVIDDAKKTVMEVPAKDIEELGANVSKDMSPEKVKFHKSGKSETILGYQCEGWVVEEEDEIREVYGTSKLGSIYEGFLESMKRMSGGKMETMMDDFEKEMMRQKMFPLKTVTKRDGAVTSAQEVTKIERRSLAASTFEIPPGYTKRSMKEEMDGAMKKMQDEMLKMQKSGKMTPEMQKMIEEQMKGMKGMPPSDEDSTKEEELKE